MLLVLTSHFDSATVLETIQSHADLVSEFQISITKNQQVWNGDWSESSGRNVIQPIAAVFSN